MKVPSTVRANGNTFAHKIAGLHGSKDSVNSVFISITVSLTTSFQLQIRCSSLSSYLSVQINYLISIFNQV